MVDAILGRWTYGKFNSPSSISATILSSLTFTASLHLFIWFSFLSIRTWSTITRVFSPILSTALHGLTPHLSHSSFLSFYSLLICSCVYFLGLVSLRLTVGLTLYFSLQVMEMRKTSEPSALPSNKYSSKILRGTFSLFPIPPLLLMKLIGLTSNSYSDRWL